MENSLSVSQVRRVFAPEEISKLKNASPKATELLPGQERATKALHLGLGVPGAGFNIYVSGQTGIGKLEMVKHLVLSFAKTGIVPLDWCYVHNFTDPYYPRKLDLPAGLAANLKKDMLGLVRNIIRELRKDYEKGDYLLQKAKTEEKAHRDQGKLFKNIVARAEKQGFRLKKTSSAIIAVPVKNGRALSDAQFNRLPLKIRNELLKKKNALQKVMQKVTNQILQLDKIANEDINKLKAEIATSTISHLFLALIERYRRFEGVINYLNEVKNDVMENLISFYDDENGLPPDPASPFFNRYSVNVLIDNSKLDGAPVIIELNPTYNNLFGKVEKESDMGAIYTDFTLIRKGALHQANGGYIIIRAEELLRNLFAYDSLKRALRNKEIVIEEVSEQLGLLTTKTLHPEAIPLDVKVILIGSPEIYSALYEYDSEFSSLFKIKSDFDIELNIAPDLLSAYVGYLLNKAAAERVLPMNDEAVAKVLEHGLKLSENQNKISTRVEDIFGIIKEANYYASETKAAGICAADILRAISEKKYRSGLVPERLMELINKRVIGIDISGEKIGQINGLSIYDIGDLRFGLPSRITCTVGPGEQGIIGIEREAELSGPIHTKGVLILSGYLSQQFFRDKLLSLSARIAFEQSYSQVEGDSASLAELCTILSALAEVPIRQGISVTGSINQKGEVQAIGGVNEKIEGYFQVCKAIGFNGEQGVIIPSTNIENLMLDEEVCEAIRIGQFKIWAIKTVEEGLEILSGIKTGSVTEAGSFISRVNDKLQEYSKMLQDVKGNNHRFAFKGNGSATPMVRTTLG